MGMSHHMTQNQEIRLHLRHHRNHPSIIPITQLKMRLENLTPHPVNVYGDMLAPVFTLKACPNPARVIYKETDL